MDDDLKIASGSELSFISEQLKDIMPSQVQPSDIVELQA
jgi:hypothetical protein